MNNGAKQDFNQTIFKCFLIRKVNDDWAFVKGEAGKRANFKDNRAIIHRFGLKFNKLGNKVRDPDIQTDRSKLD